MRNNNLNNILKDWDRNLKSDFKEPSELKRSILSQIKAGHRISPDSNIYFFVKKKYIYNLAAAATVFIIAIGVFILNSRTSKPGPSTPDQLAVISNDEMSDMKKISGEVCRLFNDKVQWIIKSGGRMEIKPSDITDTSSSSSKILVRQTVFRKTDKGWDKVYIADIITNPEQQVVFKDDKNNGYLWTHQAGDNVIALEGQMNLKVNGEIINLNYSGGQPEKTPVILKNIKNSNSEYIVYQTVNRI
ncbi:MAG TPA: hypothetical protein DCZ94_07005 [Lentisphaeria bacterium]|nr:MAG: hypothetical protein A2X48_10380 [Lentisphaerae bacterium GWF2_49_21]HBC86683.1 hypothetical protein [Lentisphaeria bacterium]